MCEVIRDACPLRSRKDIVRGHGRRCWSGHNELEVNDILHSCLLGLLVGALSGTMVLVGNSLRVHCRNGRDPHKLCERRSVVAGGRCSVRRCLGRRRRARSGADAEKGGLVRGLGRVAIDLGNLGGFRMGSACWVQHSGCVRVALNPPPFGLGLQGGGQLG